MTTYKEIFGKPVKVLSSDPTDAGAEGQVWYNTTSGTFKTVVAVGAWSSGGSLGTARGWIGSAGDKTAGIVFGGSLNPYPTFTGITEEYNGSSWTAGGTSPIVKLGSTGAGTQTAALMFGGGAPYVSTTVEYDGSSWTGGGNMVNASRDRAPAGTQTAALGMTGYIPGSQGTTTSEEYNGSSWTAITNAGSARYYGTGFGVSTSAIVAGGTSPPTSSTAAAELWNGSSWTAVGSLPGTISKAQAGGTTSDGCVFGGIGSPYYPSYPKITTKNDWDGSSWSTSPASMSTARAFFGGASSSSPSVYATGGQTNGSPTYLASTEEFGLTIYSPVAATWASGGALGTARSDFSWCRISNCRFSFWWTSTFCLQEQQKNIMDHLGAVVEVWVLLDMEHLDLEHKLQPLPQVEVLILVQQQ